jgi:hypothetical protein
VENGGGLSIWKFTGEGGILVSLLGRIGWVYERIL